MVVSNRSGSIPRKVLLFSGHMIDAPERKTDRFRASKEPIAAAAIGQILARPHVDAGPEDLAICGGACGGDLLFAEACLARGTALELYIPFDEPTFLKESVAFAGAEWTDRFQAAKSQATLHVAPVELGALPDGTDAYERNNLWMLRSAARFGAEKLVFICLWDGKGGDGSGGTQHMMNEARRAGGQIHWLDTTKLWD